MVLLRDQRDQIWIIKTETKILLSLNDQTETKTKSV